MSLINEALSKSRNDTNAEQKRVLLGTSINDTQTFGYEGKKSVNKRKTTFLSISIFGAILACIIGFYYVCNFTKLMPKLSSREKVKIQLKNDVDFTSSYVKVSKEEAPIQSEGIFATANPPQARQDTPKVESQPAITLTQVQSDALVEPAPSSVATITQPTQEVVSPAEVQSIESSEVETHIPEVAPEQEVQTKDEWYGAYHFGMGVFYQKNNEIEKATEEYNKVIELDPDNAEVHINLGVIYKDRGDLDRAVEEYEKALAIDSWLDVGHNNLGVVYFLKGNYAEAIRHYQKAIEINPKNLEGYINLGIAYGMQKRSDEAVKAFQTAISINPRHAETQYNLAVIYDENGEIEKALLYYSKFLELYPPTESELINKVKRRIDVLLVRAGVR